VQNRRDIGLLGDSAVCQPASQLASHKIDWRPRPGSAARSHTATMRNRGQACCGLVSKSRAPVVASAGSARF